MSISKKLMTTGKVNTDYVDDVFSTYLYTGNSGTQTITNGIDLAGEGGLVWIKCRDTARNHHLVDTERGASTGTAPGKTLNTNSTSAEAVNNDIKGFNTNGFDLGSSDPVNNLNEEFASWTFRKAKNFFDVVTYRGNNSTPVTVPHNLGAVPGMIIIKSTDASSDWYVYHKDFTFPNWCALNSPDPQSTAKGAGLTAPPTAGSFTVSNGSGVVGADQDYVAYVFAHDDSDESLIKCGSYTGTGAAGNEIDLGFEPQFVWIKAASGTGDWEVLDAMRGITAGGEDAYIRLNQPYVEGEQAVMALTPTGFVLDTNWNDVNAGTIEYIYMAIRRPNKPADEFEADELFYIDTSTNLDVPNFQTRAQNSNDPAFPVDFVINRASIFSASNNFVGTRMLGETRLFTNQASVESAESNHAFDFMDGFADNNLSNWTAWMWRRAPGFFDVVAYNGNGSGTAIDHNLTVPPEMIWTKRRSSSFSWAVWHKDLGAGINGYADSLVLNDHVPAQLGSGYSDTPPTAEQYYLNSSADTNDAIHTYVAYLFASVPGICDVGSYVGNGTTLDIDCGFSNGARFVLIKRSDLSANWDVFDTARGISSGNDPFFSLNVDSAQTSSLDCLDPLSSGFTVKHPNVNTNGGEYIYYAIA